MADYDEAVATEAEEVVRGEFGETVAQMIDRAIDLYWRYGDDAEQAFYDAIQRRWDERHPNARVDPDGKDTQ